MLKLFIFKALSSVWGRRNLTLVCGMAAAIGVFFLAREYTGGSIAGAVAVAVFLMVASATLAAGVVLKLRASIAGINNRINKVQLDVQSVRAEFRERSDLIQRIISQIEIEATEIKQLAGDINRVIEVRTNHLAVDLGRVKREVDGIDFRSQRMAGDFDKARRLIETFDDRWQQSVATIKQDLSSNLAQFKKIDERLSEKAKQTQLKAHIAQADKELESLRDRIADVRHRVQGYHVHERSLNKKDIDQLISRWVEPLGLTLSERQLGYIAARIEAIENLSVGRLATATPTMIVRILSALSVNTNSLKLLEIGALFGVASSCFYEILTSYNKSVDLTLLDPFEGYYGPGAPDLITGVSVSRQNVERNLKAARVPPSQVCIVERFSHEPEALQELSEKEFDVLLIDGDHSYDGVRKDFEIFGPLVKVGGVILFDDYEVSEWPDIKKYVDDAPMKMDCLRLLATGFRTAAFEVVARVPSTSDD